MPVRPGLWRHPWSQWVRDLLVSSSNPQGTISNSDLEMAGGLLHLDCAAQTFDIRERTILSRGITSILPSRRGRGTPPPTPCQPTCCACLGYTSASTATFPVSTNSLALPTLWRIPCPGIFILPGPSCTHNCRTASARPLVIKSGRHHRGSFPQYTPRCARNSRPGSIFWSRPSHRHLVGKVARHHS